MRIFVFVFLLAGIFPRLWAAPPAKLPHVTNSLQQMVRSSGQIFSGVVVNVDRAGADSDAASGITRVTIRVQEAVRGARRGQLLQVREWAGLWNAGERYQPGQHVFLFLYPNSKLGLTSPVAGPLGRLNMDGFGRVQLNNPTTQPPQTIDVRLFATALRRVAKE